MRRLFGLSLGDWRFRVGSRSRCLKSLITVAANSDEIDCRSEDLSFTESANPLGMPQKENTAPKPWVPKGSSTKQKATFIGVRAGGATAPPPPTFGQLRFFGQQDKFGQSFIKRFPYFFEEIDVCYFTWSWRNSTSFWFTESRWSPEILFFGLFRNCLNCDSLRWSHTHFMSFWLLLNRVNCWYTYFLMFYCWKLHCTSWCGVFPGVNQLRYNVLESYLRLSTGDSQKFWIKRSESRARQPLSRVNLNVHAALDCLHTKDLKT